MITPEQATPLIKKTLEDFLNSCHCETREDAANVLMRLAGSCGVAMALLVGRADAVDRMAGATEFTAEHGVLNPVPGRPVQ